MIEVEHAQDRFDREGISQRPARPTQLSEWLQISLERYAMHPDRPLSGPLFLLRPALHKAPIMRARLTYQGTFKIGQELYNRQWFSSRNRGPYISAIECGSAGVCTSRLHSTSAMTY